MSEEKRRRVDLSLQQKVLIINEVDKAASQAQVARDRKIPKSTIQGIIRDRSKILAAYAEFSPKVKRARKSVFPKTEEALYKWFQVQRNRNIPVNGPLLLGKAKEFSVQLGEEDFTGSPGWLEKFKKRNNISFYTISGEAGSVDDQTVKEWLEHFWSEMKQGYEEKDIFNCDESACFYKLLPNKSLHRRGEKCTGGKLSKERITFMLCTNADGSEKLKPLIIGKAENPRAFKNIKKKSLPVHHDSNRTAWMTQSIFETWLKNLDLRMRFQRRKIILLLDGATPHKVDVSTPNVKVVFFPPNVTSKLQPLDQGVIHTTKTYYRQALIKKFIQEMDNGNEPKIDILNAIMMRSQAWSQVKPTHIRNCFKHAGIVTDQVTDEEEPVMSENDDELEIEESQFDIPLEDYYAIDSQVQVHEDMSDCDIVASVQNDEEAERSDDGEDDPEVVRPEVTHQEAVQSIERLQLWLMNSGEEETEKPFAYLRSFIQLIVKRKMQGLKQTTLDSFVMKN